MATDRLSHDDNDLETYLMPTLPRFDPANLPPYPEKPHKTGQARVNVDGKSQYLGKYGTVESHALYHLACARKLITGVVPTTRDLRNELSAVAENNDSRGTFTPSLLTVVALVLLVAITSGTLSHYLTKATVRKWQLQFSPAAVHTVQRINSTEDVAAGKPSLSQTDIAAADKDSDNHFSEAWTPAHEQSASASCRQGSRQAK
ncbi:MAG TPA: hypothetical protein QF564_02590 [Pirellulaceae bacterium]|nr:hypothetical protein [Pirellulaceae bacterium]